MIDAEEVVTSSIYPSALAAALTHRKVTMVGKHKLQSSKENKCPCCKRTMRKSIPVNFKIGDIGFLGSGYPLYFIFNRMCLLLCVFYLIALYLSPMLYLFLAKTFHVKSFIKEYELTCTMIVIFSLTILFTFEKIMSGMALVLDEDHVDPEDYSIWVRNIPIQFSRDKKMEKQITDYFEQSYKIPIKISSLCFCYNLVPLGRFLAKKKNQIKRLKMYEIEKQTKQRLSDLLFNSKQLPFEGVSEYHGVKISDDTNVQMAHFQDYIKKKISSLNEMISVGYRSSDLMFVGEAFVSFETVEMRDEVLKFAGQSYFYGNKLVIEQAPNPRDIFWHNLHLDSEDLKLRSAFSYVSCLALIFMIVTIKIVAAWAGLMLEGTIFESSILRSSTSVLIIGFNIMIQDVFLKQLTHYQGHTTKIRSLTTFTFKCIALQLLTCFIVPYISSVFIMQMKEEQTYLQKMDNLINTGAMISLILISISHKTLIKSLKIKMSQLGGWRFIPKKMLTVKQLCDLYQYPEFEIEKRYSQTIKNTVLAFVFGIILPKTLVYVIIHLLFAFWIDKYNFVRRRSVMVVLNHKMNKRLLKFISFVLPVFLASVMVYQREKSVILIVLMVISFFARKMLIRKQLGVKRMEKAKEVSFWEANVRHFYTDYRRQNPALQGIAQEEFEQKIKQLNLDMNFSAHPPKNA